MNEATEGPRLRELVAAEVRAHLARHRISGRELSRRLGEANTWATRRLNGTIPMDVDDLDRIAAALDISPKVLLRGVFESAFGWKPTRNSCPRRSGRRAAARRWSALLQAHTTRRLAGTNRDQSRMTSITESILRTAA